MPHEKKNTIVAGEPALDATDLERSVADAIAACDGDPVAAVRALIVTHGLLHHEIDRLRSLISRGFARGKLTLLDLP